MNDSLGDRMKRYEGVPRLQLTPKVPVVVRLDGKAFHSLTRKMQKPWDQEFSWCMWNTAIELCKQMQGAVLAYIQSDEISVLLVDHQSPQAQGWFDYDVQKVVSVSASMAGVFFNEELSNAFNDYDSMPPAYFDSRCFNVPSCEVTNYFIWRQQDATRNSIQSLARSQFSHRECHDLSCAQLQDKLFLEKQINWNDCETWQKRGVCISKVPVVVRGVAEEEFTRNRWTLDLNIPIFTQNRHYIETLLTIPTFEE